MTSKKSSKKTIKKIRAVKQQEQEKHKERSKKVYSTIEVDLWSTKLHKQEIGIKRDAERAQKSRQWTKDMDQIGEIKKDGEKYGIVAIREKLWKTKDIFQKRFVIKTFTPGEYWRSSIEQLQGESISCTIAAQEPCAVFACIFQHTSKLAKIYYVPHKRRFQGEIFRISYVDDNDILNNFVIDDKRFTLGSDWVVKDVHNRMVAFIDSKKFNVGGKAVIKIFDQELANDKTFVNTLILFGAMLRYYREIQKAVKELAKELRISDHKLKLDESEADLYQNPRKMNY